MEAKVTTHTPEPPAPEEPRKPQQPGIKTSELPYTGAHDNVEATLLGLAMFGLGLTFYKRKRV